MKSQQLLLKLSQALSQNDSEAQDNIIEQILSAPLSSDEEILAHYRVGLFLFIQRQDYKKAVAIFKNIIDSGIRCDEVQSARISYAQCLFALDKVQSAILQLRKVIAYYSEPNSIKALALDYLATFSSKASLDSKTMVNVHNDRVNTLLEIIKTEKDNNEKALLLLRLSSAYQQRNNNGDMQRAKEAINDFNSLDVDLIREYKNISTDLSKNLHNG